MSILVFVEDWNGVYKKASFEAVGYAKSWASMIDAKVVAVTSTQAPAAELGGYGADHCIQIELGQTAMGIAGQLEALSSSASGVVIAGTSLGRSVAPALAALKDAALSTNTISLPLGTAPFQIKRGAFSSKSIETIELSGASPIISFVPNSIGIKVTSGEGAVETQEISSLELLKVIGTEVASGKVALPEAEAVVSGGRGLKGPENWGIIEELAEVLGAATACSKPVSDIGWRPHSEHVGQTGIQVNPNLYIAIGISGAIQHLAGVSASKTIVVVNTDPEAPFFKAADYGIVGDAFEVVPKLVNALRAFKAAS
ncbi:MAG TPA: electron transfer flavoprotein subunit alpha [Cryomorphaceae bacterium]|nr:electron transfer flavoprotein subunit alpha [Cryomorphaceae bacterium]|tara:strand:+ start:5740 stop:6678 length:939 start_codon:yes stop_codon:yes gene_type:complete